MRLLPYGPTAVLVEFDSLAEVVHAAERWRAANFIGIVDIVPAARTVLVQHDGSFDSTLLTSTPVAELGHMPRAPREVTLETRYDGPDLDWVAQQIGASPTEVIELHSAPVYTVAFCGFMPGFGYLVGLPEVLWLPRRQTPRERVPKGAVAIAAEFSGVYPAASPGGWHLLGTTQDVLWNEHSDQPALLSPGTIVRFVPQ